MFHVDPKADTQGSLNTSDDVIVTMQGNVGVGVLPDDAALPPTLTLTDGGTPSLPRSPLRIEDGNQQEGRVLTSNAAGQGAWKDLPAGFNPGKVYGLTGIDAITFKVNVNHDVFFFTADAAGSYLFEIRWWAKIYSPDLITAIVYGLYKNNVRVDVFEQYISGGTDANNASTLCLTLYSEAVANDAFFIRVYASMGVAQTTHTTQATPAWMQGKVNVLRVN